MIYLLHTELKVVFHFLTETCSLHCSLPEVIIELKKLDSCLCMLQRHNELEFLLAPLALTILRWLEGHAAESEVPEASHKLSHENSAVDCAHEHHTIERVCSKHLDKLAVCS